MISGQRFESWSGARRCSHACQMTVRRSLGKVGRSSFPPHLSLTCLTTRSVSPWSSAFSASRSTSMAVLSHQFQRESL